VTTWHDLERNDRMSGPASSASRAPRPAPPARRRMRRILFTTQPGYGHLHPLVPLARAAQAAGHEVLVATSDSLCLVVEGAGLPCVAAGYDWLLAEERAAFPELPELADLPFGDAHFRLQLTRIFRDITARRMLPDLLALCRDWRPDVIVRDDQEHGGLLAAELLGIPHAVAGVLWLYPPEYQALAADALGALLADFGLADIPPLERAYRYLTLAAMPAEWPAPEEAVPPTTHVLRPIPHFRKTEVVPGLLGDLPPGPTVHANLGTIISRQTNLNEVLLAAFSGAPYNLILSVGPEQDPLAYGPQPPNVRILNSIPPGLPEACAAAIVHGGYGSIMGALVAGVPLVVLPVAADQPRNARRCVDLGVGVALADGARSPQEVRAAVTQVLEDRAYRDASHRLRASLATLPGPEHGVALLEELIRTRAPLPGGAG
jgi:UDP:flavonoid glycosyltransferase YjiC (YdhE family)